MNQKLAGKSVVVTGGGSGIGRAVATAMATEGARMVINDIGRKPDGKMAADIVVEEIKSLRGTACANYDTVATISGGENIIRTAVNNYGCIDVLVNCAGNFTPGFIVDTKESDWDATMNVHVKGHFSCCKAAAIEMLKQKSGRIINFSSRAAFGLAGSFAYSTAKTAILGLTTSLANELKGAGITVNAIIPSAVTPLFPGKEKKHRAGGGFPYPISLEPAYIAPIIIFLATDKAKGITGQFIYASGSDLVVYNLPLQPRTLIRKESKWTVDEISALFPSTLLEW